MKTINDLVRAVRAGSTPVVTFGKGIEDKEEYAMAGMRARVLRSSGPDRHGLIELCFDFEEFAGHNKPFETADYYDQQQRPRLTAREAGFYKPQDSMYFDDSEPLEGMLDVEQGVLSLYSEYVAAESQLTYVQWLERLVLHSRGEA